MIDAILSRLSATPGDWTEAYETWTALPPAVPAEDGGFVGGETRNAVADLRSLAAIVAAADELVRMAEATGDARLRDAIARYHAARAATSAHDGRRA